MTSSLDTSTTLTPYKTASLAELWHISYPLMLTALSGNLMMFMDRVLLCRYQPTAMAAVTTVGMIFTIFQFAGISIASIAEVFVSKYNGANQQAKIGPLVWQMIWFSALTAFVFFPVGYLCGELLLPLKYHAFGVVYFKTIMFFGPMFPLVAALSSFFIGQGSVKVITYSTIAVNFINIILAYVFIFGLCIIPQQGAMGAALATGIAISLQAAFLFIIFLRKEHRLKCNTACSYIKSAEFLRCLKVGVPNATGYLIEMAAWAFLLQMITRTDEAHIMVLAFGQAIFLLVPFTTDGLQKAIIAVASNLIGMQKLRLLTTLIKSGLKLHGLIVLFFAIPFLIFPELLVNLFFSTEESFINYATLLAYTKTTCMWVLFYFVFDGLVWVSAGILTAFEDTVFIMIMNTVSVWLLAILPNYIAISYFNASPASIWKLMTIYALVNSIGFCLRYIKLRLPMAK